MKILISSYWILGNTGYGNQTFYLAKELLKYGHEIYLIAWDLLIKYSPVVKSLEVLYGPTLEGILKAHPEKKETCLKLKYLIPPEKPSPRKGHQPNLNKILEPLIQNLKIEKLIMLHDIWPFKLESQFTIQSFLWLPVHLSTLEKETIKNIKFINWIISPSQYGYQCLTPHHPKVYLIPHIIPFVTILENKKEIRSRILGFTKDSFLVTMVARNSEENDRKAFKENLKGFTEFYKSLNSDEKNKIYLYLHTDWEGAIPINELVKELPSKILIKPDLVKYRACLYSSSYIYSIYKASDLLLNVSCAEGFGIPLVEAQMMDCTVLTNHTTAMPENNFFGYQVRGNTKDLNWERPNPKEIKEKLQIAFEDWNKEDSKEISEIKKIQKEIQKERIKNKFDPVTLGRQWNYLISFGHI